MSCPKCNELMIENQALRNKLCDRQTELNDAIAEANVAWQEAEVRFNQRISMIKEAIENITWSP